MANRIIRYLVNRYLSQLGTRPDKRELPIVIYNDRAGKRIMVESFYEKKFVDTIINALAFDASKYACLDIGANIGNYTLQFKNIFREVYSFEPQIRTFKLLSLNTAHLDNVRVYNYGLSNDESQPVFKISTTNVVSGSQYFYDKSYYEEKVTLKVYDAHFNHEIALVKIDVAGNEKNTIQGMKRNLMKYKPVITFDYDINKQDNYALLELLESMGYTSFWIRKRHFIERYIPSRKGPIYYMKLLVRFMTPPVKQELEQIDLRKAHINYYLVTTFHPDSQFKLKV